MWQSGHFKLFLSHTSVHRGVGHDLRVALLDHGISLFVAHEDIEAGTQWRDQIETALREMDALAALVTADFHASSWTDQEVGWALGSAKPVVPLIYDAAPYGFFGKVQGLSIACKSYAGIAREIADILVADPLSARPMAEAQATCLCRARTPVHIKHVITRLERYQTIPDDVLDSLDAAIRSNPRVKKAKILRRLLEEVIDGHRLLNQA